MYATEVVYGRQFQSVVRMCQLVQPTLAYVVFAIWYLPSIVIAIFCIAKIRFMMISLDKKQVLPVVAMQNTEEPKLRRKSAKNAIR